MSPLTSHSRYSEIYIYIYIIAIYVCTWLLVGVGGCFVALIEEDSSRK